MKKWLLILLLLAAAGGGFYYWQNHTGTQSLTERSLTYAEVRRTTIRDIVSATGLIEPREIVVVSSETPGTVVRLSGRIGETVTEGDELAQLDDRKIALKLEEAKNGIQLANAALLQAEAAVTQAQAARDAAASILKIQDELANAGGFRTEREQARANYQATLAGIKAAEAGLEVVRAKKLAAQTACQEAELVHKLTRIKVPDLYQPMRGTAKREFLILERKVHEGQMVGPQSGPLFTLAGNLDVVEMHTQVVEGDVNKIRPGLTAVFKVTNYDDEDSDFTGVIKQIRPLSSMLKGAVYYNAVIEVKNRKDPRTNEWQLRPGMTASVDIVRYEHKDAWRVPIGALNFKMELAYQTEATKEHLAQWEKRADKADWRPLWIWDSATQAPRPIFVRIGGKKNGETGLKDSEGNEILEWEPGTEPADALRIIIDAPKARAPGLLDQPANLKI